MSNKQELLEELDRLYESNLRVENELGYLESVVYRNTDRISQIISILKKEDE